MNDLISVVVPVYKVEDYIEKCIRSLLSQTYTNFEALIVDDGSPDRSIEIAKRIVADDPRFVFFTQENKGLGPARNTALDNAKGAYIAFLDSDDYYEDDYLDVMLNEIKKDNADVCICNSRNVNLDGKQLKINYNNLSGYIHSEDYSLSRGYILNFMWDKLFKVDCFYGLRFDPLIKTYEDVPLLFRVIFNKKIVSVDKVLYNYVQRSGSITHTLPKTYIEDRFSGFIVVRDFYNKEFSEGDQRLKNIKYHFLNNFIFFCSVNIAKHSKEYLIDINRLLAKDSFGFFTFKNLLINADLPLRARLSLLLLKTSPLYYRKFVHAFLKAKKGSEVL